MTKPFASTGAASTFATSLDTTMAGTALAASCMGNADAARAESTSANTWHQRLGHNVQTVDRVALIEASTKKFDCFQRATHPR